MNEFLKQFNDNFDLLRAQCDLIARDFPNVAEPASLFQTVVRRMYEHPKATPDDWKGLFRHVIRRVCWDRLRRSHSRPAPMSAEQLYEYAVDADGNPAAETEEEEEISHYLNLYNDPQMKQMASLELTGALSQQKIAEKFGLSLAAVRTRLAKIKEKRRAFARRHDGA